MKAGDSSTCDGYKEHGKPVAACFSIDGRSIHHRRRYKYSDIDNYQTGNKLVTVDIIARLKKHLIALGEWDDARHAAMDLELAETVKASAREAEKNGVLGHGMHQPFETMFEGVFEEMPWHLKEQLQQAVDEKKAAGL